MPKLKKYALAVGASALLFSAAYADLSGKVIGFSQIGSESG